MNCESLAQQVTELLSAWNVPGSGSPAVSEPQSLVLQSPPCSFLSEIRGDE